MEAKLRAVVFVVKGAAVTDDGSKESKTKIERIKLKSVV